MVRQELTLESSRNRGAACFPDLGIPENSPLMIGTSIIVRFLDCLDFESFPSGAQFRTSCSGFLISSSCSISLLSPSCIKVRLDLLLPNFPTSPINANPKFDRASFVPSEARNSRPFAGSSCSRLRGTPPIAANRAACCSHDDQDLSSKLPQTLQLCAQSAQCC